MIEKITKYLSEYNFYPFFDPKNYHEYIYSGEVQTARFGVVKIDLHFSRHGIISFPLAYINESSRNKFIPYHFPHLDDSWQLCYHDNSIVFDIVNIKQSVNTIFTNINYIFDTVQIDDMNEIIPEFKSYWNVSRTLFSHFANVPECANQSGMWFVESKCLTQSTVRVFSIDEIPTIQDCKWPIENFIDLKNWIKNDEISKEIKKHLYINLRDKKDKITFVFYSKKEEYLFGIDFLYTTPLLQQKEPKRLHNKTINMIFQNHKVERFWIDNIVDRNLVYSNLPSEFPTLEKYKIAVIGAGTIGSNLCSMLVRLGAGTTKENQLAIIDFDIYKPENYSRHLLPFSDFGKKKSKALVEDLKRCNPNLNLESYIGSVEKYYLNQFDIVIDSTGEENVTDFLNKKIYANKLNGVFIISWIHVTGKKVEVLILPNRSCPCHKCFKINIPIEKKFFNDKLPKREGCSSVFVPFPIILSVSAALLTVHVLLDYLKGKIKTTTLYSQNIIDDNKITKQIINFAQECDVCLKN